MTDMSASCPQGQTYTVESSTRMCTRSHTNKHACSSVIFPTHRVPYTKVYGRAQGYQYWSTNAFYNYYGAAQTTLESSYVTGLSVTYGSPQIWTFAVGQSKDYMTLLTLSTPPVPFIMVQLRLRLLVIVIFASRETLGTPKACDLLLILCGTHRGV